MNLIGWIAAYVGLITLYTQLPESTWIIRPALSLLAQGMIAVILVAAIVKIREA